MDETGHELKWHELWRAQCAAVPDIEDRFGTMRALAYIVGEKFLEHLKAMDAFPELKPETPKFVTEIKNLFQPWEIAEYFAQVQSANSVEDDAEDNEVDDIDRESIIDEAERVVLLDQARKLLVG